MVNDNVLIKFERARGHATDWPEYVIQMKERLKECKLGFPGLGNDHLSLIRFEELQPGEIFIWDPWLESLERLGDEAPLMLRLSQDMKTCLVEGIGCGIDSARDPDRLRIRWMDTIETPPIHPEELVLRVDVRPTLNGGPGYYYFFKAYRDARL